MLSGNGLPMTGSSCCSAPEKEEKVGEPTRRSSEGCRATLEMLMLNFCRKRLGLESSEQRGSFSTAVEVVAVVADALVDGLGLLDAFVDVGDWRYALTFPLGRIRLLSRFRTEVRGVSDALSVALLALFCAVLPNLESVDGSVSKNVSGIGDRRRRDPSLSEAGGVERSMGASEPDRCRCVGSVLVKGRFLQEEIERVLAGRDARSEGGCVALECEGVEVDIMSSTEGWSIYVLSDIDGPPMRSSSDSSSSSTITKLPRISSSSLLSCHEVNFDMPGYARYGLHGVPAAFAMCSRAFSFMSLQKRCCSFSQFSTRRALRRPCSACEMRPGGFGHVRTEL